MSDALSLSLPWLRGYLTTGKRVPPEVVERLLADRDRLAAENEVLRARLERWGHCSDPECDRHPTDLQWASKEVIAHDVFNKPASAGPPQEASDV